MKHTWKTTIFLLLLFVLAQIAGLLITLEYIHVQEGQVSFNDLPLGIERPDVTPSYAVGYIVLGVLLGTALLLSLIKFNLLGMWKFWYAMALLFSLIIAFNAFLPTLVSFLIAAVMVYLRIFRSTQIVHHLTEIFLYGGIAAIFVDMLSLWSVVILLGFISLYDMYAVWKSKHMVTLAKFQTGSQLFAGLQVLPKGTKIATKKEIKQGKAQRAAILGGGDIAFPLLFIATLMKEMVVHGASKQSAFFLALVPVATTTLALFLLFYFAKEKKFYPAMPFLSMGCIVGLMLLYI